MISSEFKQMVADRSGFTIWDIYKMLDALGDLINEEVYAKGDTVSIGGLGEFKQVTVKKRRKEFKVLSFRPIPDMNNGSWDEWYKY